MSIKKFILDFLKSLIIPLIFTLIVVACLHHLMQFARNCRDQGHAFGWSIKPGQSMECYDE